MTFFHRPLSEYDDGRSDLYLMVRSKQRDEYARLKEIQQNLAPKNSQQAEAHEWQCERAQKDFRMQRVLALAEHKNKTRRIGALSRVNAELRAFLLIAAVSAAALGIQLKTAKTGRNICRAGVWLSLGLAGSCIAGMGYAFSVGRRLHHDNVRIRSNLMCWHHLTTEEKNVVYQETVRKNQSRLYRILDRVGRPEHM